VPAHIDGYRATYLRFKKGSFLLGAEQQPVPPGTEYVAVSVSESWVRLEKNTPPVRIPREPDKPFPRRDELGDLDQRLWPLFADKPCDPWTHRLELLLVERETGRPVIFSIGTTTGKPAVEDLCRLTVFQRRTRGPRARPIIKPKVGTMQLRLGPVLVPQFEVIDWIDSAEMPEAASSQLQSDVMEHLERRSAIDPKAKTAGLQPSRRKAEPSRPKAKDVSWDDDLDDIVKY